MDIGPHNAHIDAGDAGERTVRFVLTLDRRPVTGLNTTTLQGYIRLSWIERDGTASNAGPSNLPAEVDSTNCPGEYSLELTTGEATHGEVMVHIDDGNGNTFDYQYILHRFYGGTGNTGGNLHR